MSPSRLSTPCGELRRGCERASRSEMPRPAHGCPPVAASWSTGESRCRDRRHSRLLLAQLRCGGIQWSRWHVRGRLCECAARPMTHAVCSIRHQLNESSASSVVAAGGPLSSIDTVMDATRHLVREVKRFPPSPGGTNDGVGERTSVASTLKCRLLACSRTLRLLAIATAMTRRRALPVSRQRRDQPTLEA